MDKRKQIIWQIASVAIIIIAYTAQSALPAFFPNGLMYQTRTKLLGYPLLDIRLPSQSLADKLNRLPMYEGMDALTARGWCAVGMSAIGVVTVGVVSIGIFSVGVGVLGLVVGGVLALGLRRSFGVVAISIWNAYGVIAIDRKGIRMVREDRPAHSVSKHAE